jgi:DNA mismatch endonuclease (patch repair protein)
MTNADTRHRVLRSSSEQDRAAGGRDNRLVAVDGGAVSRASVELKQYTDNGACWAYLRWSAGGKTHNRYLGRVDGVGRVERLRQGWELARSRGLLDSASRPPTPPPRKAARRSRNRD